MEWGRGGGDTHKKLVSLENFLFGWKQLLLERENLLGGKIPGLFLFMAMSRFISVALE